MAKYWIEVPPTVGTGIDFKLDTQKKKRYAKAILAAGNNIGSLKAMAEFWLNHLGETDVTSITENGEFTDAVLKDSAYSSATFEAFAGVQPGDNQKGIEW